MEKRNKIKDSINIIVQIILGMIFLISAVLKATDFNIFLESIESFGFIPNYLIIPISISIIVLEFIIGFLITMNYLVRISLILGISLLSIFGIIGIYSVLLGKNWVCACFGAVFLNSFSLSTIIRDFLILSISVYAYFNYSNNYSLNNLRNWRTILILVLISLISLLLLTFTIIRLNNIPIKLSIGSKIGNYKAKTLDNHNFSIYERTSPFLLLIIFDVQKDCASCLAEFTLWKNIFETYYPHIEVIGIAYAPNQNFLQTWINARNILFPIIFDRKRGLISKFKLSTPIKILLNSKNEVILMQKSSSNPDQQNEFIKRIKTIIEKHNDPTLTIINNN